jgi:hypothetical protein
MSTTADAHSFVLSLSAARGERVRAPNRLSPAKREGRGGERENGATKIPGLKG